MDQATVHTNEKDFRSERDAILRGTKLRWAHWLIVGLSLLLTVGASYFSMQQVEQKNRAEFERQAFQVIELVQERMQLYENALWGGVAFIDAKDGQIEYSDWVTYADSLHIDTRYSGINGIGVIYNVQKEEFASYLADQRGPRPDYAVHPEHQQSEYWPITYIEPVATNLKAVGLDMAFETNRYTGVQRARDLGIAQVTGPITLVQDAKQTPGFLFYAPFYQKGRKPDTVEVRKKESHGVTYAPFIFNRLMDGTLASTNRQLIVRISDEGDLLFDDREAFEAGGVAEDPEPMVAKVIEVPMYGRTWTFELETSLAFRQLNANSQPYMILVGGLIIDAMLLGLFIFLTQANRRALEYADNATLALREGSALLERSNKDLEQFAYVASHDLKAPLRGIHNLATWIEENIQDKMDDETRDYMSLLKSRIARLEGLLAGLLDYSRAGRSELWWKEVDLDQMVASIADLLAAETQGFLVKHDLPYVNAPAVALEQILRNLISNAIKHHDQDSGTIEVSCNRGEDHNLFSVSDDGPGIPEEYRDQVFKMFQTLKPRDEVEGSGMGLAIVKKLVEQLGGEIWIEESGGERGLSVWFTIAAEG